MLPTLLVQVLIFLFAVMLPIFCALHSVVEKDREGCVRWTFYLGMYSVIEFIIRPVEPWIEYIVSFLPLGLYWETKLVYLMTLVVLRTGVLDRFVNAASLFHAGYGKRGWRLLQEQASPYLKIALQLVGRLRAKGAGGDDVAPVPAAKKAAASVAAEVTAAQ